jgi:hypothetical protein
MNDIHLEELMRDSYQLGDEAAAVAGDFTDAVEAAREAVSLGTKAMLNVANPDVFDDLLIELQVAMEHLFWHWGEVVRALRLPE